jgi:L-lactate dehydrogenase complex protein LldG
VNARDDVLARLSAQRVEPVALPELEGEWTRYADPRERFRIAVGEAAGSIVSVGPDARLQEVVADLGVVRAARTVCSFSSIVAGNRELPTVPHDFRDVDVVITPAAFGVAENGAVWIDESMVPLRAGLWLAQHLVVLLPIGELVDNMHQAYERLGLGVDTSGFGCFIAGPSKTADIEQLLVIGAHGPRSLTLVEY